MLRARNVDAGYGKLRVLKHVSLHVNPGEVVTIIGANGAGKTTLLNCIAGLVTVRSGTLELGARERLKASAERLDITARAAEERVMLGCSLVPEGRQVFATMSVEENLLLGAYVRYKRGQDKLVQAEMDRIYDMFPVLRQRTDQLAGTLSGGEQQMLAMGRALMADPALLMMDEPSMGLAPLIVKEIFNTISRLKQEGRTVLLVEQNAKGALQVADRGYVIETGRIVLQGFAQELLDNHDVQRAYLGRDVDAEARVE